MHGSVQINLPLEVLIQNDSRMCPGRVATFQCGEYSFPSDKENNHNVQRPVFLYYYQPESTLRSYNSTQNLTQTK